MARAQVFPGQDGRYVGFLGGFVNCEEWPTAGHALELMFSAGRELKARSGGEVDDGSGYEDLVRIGQRRDPTGGVDRDPGDVGRSELDFSGVEAGPQRDALVAGVLENRGGAVHSSRGAVEGRQDPVASLLDEPSPVGGNDWSMVWSCVSRTCRQASSPRAANCSVESWMSVNNTVATGRSCPASISGSSRKRSISASTGAVSPKKRSCSAPGSSTNRAPGIRLAAARLVSMSHSRSSRRCSTSVGTLTAERAGS
jgi:hypothetical protein